MPRRKTTPPAEEVIEGIPELDDDEQFVKESSTKQTFRKEKVTRPEPAAKTPTAEPPVIDFDEDEDDDEPAFSETSLAALQFGPDDDIQNEFCNILVRRNPDSMQDNFATPNTAVLTLPAMRNVELAADRGEIEERVREIYGGGHYFFQIQYRGQVGKSWKVSLSDLPSNAKVKSANVPQLDVTPNSHDSSAIEANPFDQFLDTLRRQKEMKDLLFGDEMKELDRLRREAAERQNQPPGYRPSETLQILETALKSDNPGLQDKLLKIAFPADEGDAGGGHWITDVLKLGFEHKDELAGVVQMLFGGIPPQPPAGGLENFLRQPPPTLPEPAGTLEPPAGDGPPLSRFQRKVFIDSESDHDDGTENMAGVDTTTEGKGNE